MSQPIRGQGCHLVFFSIGLENTNVVEDIGILLSVKFHSAVSEEKSKMLKVNDDGRTTNNV